MLSHMTSIASIVPTRTTAREEIAAAVRAHFAVRNLKDSQVARQIGMSQSALSRRTNEEIAFDSDVLGSIAELFGISYVELVQMPVGAPARTTPVYDICPEIPRIGSLKLNESDAPEHEHLAPVTALGRVS